jgi:hypothetical protein
MNGDSMVNDAADAEAFDFFATYEINEVVYDIYLPNNIESAIYYTHEISDVKSASTEWIVNFVYEPIYHVDEGAETKEVWSKLYEKLQESEAALEEKCEFDVMLFDPYSSVELEFVLNNQNSEESTYVTFVTYLPIKMFNQTTRKTLTVGIPVNIDVLLKAGVMVK